MSNANSKNVARIDNDTALARIADLEAKIAALSAPSEKDATLVALLDKAISALATRPQKASSSRAVAVATERDYFGEACKIVHLSPGENRGRIFRALVNRGPGEYSVREIAEECGLDPTKATVVAMFGKVAGHADKYPDGGFTVRIVNDRGAFANGSLTYSLLPDYFYPGRKSEPVSENKSENA
jgi:hypothetical protein